MYYNEDHILDLRLNYLNNFIDHFVIVESIYNHKGEKKGLNFDMKNFQKFKEKIIYIVVDKLPDTFKINDNDNENSKNSKYILNGYKRDHFQRSQITKGIKIADENDLILISDLDEIPNLENLSFSKINNKLILFKQIMCYYKFNLHLKSYNWVGTRACKKKYFISPNWLRDIKDKAYPFWRIDTLFSKNKFSNLKIIKNGGWHFTQLKKPEDLFEKIKNDEHHNEFDKLDMNIDYIKNMIDNKFIEYDHLSDSKSISKIGNRFKLKSIDINSNMPTYLKKNIKKYEDWFDFDFKNI